MKQTDTNEILRRGTEVEIVGTPDVTWQIAEYDEGTKLYELRGKGIILGNKAYQPIENLKVVTTDSELDLIKEFQDKFNPRRASSKRSPTRNLAKREGHKLSSTATFEYRVECLMPSGIPRYIRCYDNGGASADRYTVCFTGRYRHKTGGSYWYIGMSSEPTHPQGVGMLGEHTERIDYPSYQHLGKPITFKELPEACQAVVIDRYRYLWDIEENGNSQLFTEL